MFQIVLYNGKDPTIISQCSTQIRIPLICTLRFIYMNLYQKDLILINYIHFQQNNLIPIKNLLSIQRRHLTKKSQEIGFLARNEFIA